MTWRRLEELNSETGFFFLEKLDTEGSILLASMLVGCSYKLHVVAKEGILWKHSFVCWFGNNLFINCCDAEYLDNTAPVDKELIYLGNFSILVIG